jgi:hypothetical protein
MIGMEVEYGDARGRGDVREEMHSLKDGKKQRNGGDKGWGLYEGLRHGIIIISAPISKRDCEGEMPSEGMKGASPQSRWTYLEVHSAEPPDRASPVVSGSDSWLEPLVLASRAQDKTCWYGTEAWHIQNTCPYRRWDSKHLATKR